MSKKIKMDYYGEAFEDGIQFCSKRNKDCVAKATVRNDGSIETSYERQGGSKYNYISLIVTGILLVLTLAVSAIIGIGFHFTLTQLLGLINVFLSISMLYIFIRDFEKTLINPKHASLFRFNAAKVMAYKAIGKYQRVPTYEELKSLSYIEWIGNSDCITLTILFVMYIGICLTLSIQVYIILLGMLVLSFALLLGFFRFTQLFTTRKPTDRELEVAIAALQVWYDNEYVV